MARMSKVRAEALWAAILGYAEACQEVGAEGNSGEFTDEFEVRHVDRLHTNAQNNLIEVFLDVTGWEPIWRSEKDSWELKEKYRR